MPTNAYVHGYLSGYLSKHAADMLPIDPNIPPGTPEPQLDSAWLAARKEKAAADAALAHASQTTAEQVADAERLKVHELVPKTKPTTPEGWREYNDEAVKRANVVREQVQAEKEKAAKGK